MDAWTATPFGIALLLCETTMISLEAMEGNKFDAG